MNAYLDWIAKRDLSAAEQTLTYNKSSLPSALFEFQSRIVDWALDKGRAAIFADTGLGKTLMQLAWAEQVRSNAGPVLILTPLAVADQTTREARKFGVSLEGITITNYEKLHHYSPAKFAGIVLDESSILKAFDGKTRTQIINAFDATPFRLACTATPAPNDHTELGNHSQFLGLLSMQEMLAEFFIHDAAKTQDWRLKGHARTAFWRWVSSWAVMISRPSDLGYSDEGYELEPYRQRAITIEDPQMQDSLFAGAASLSDLAGVRRATLDERTAAISAMISIEPDEPTIVWCEYNTESTALTRAIPNAFEIVGSMKPEQKRDLMLRFTDHGGVLVSKPSICGFGMNWQHCAREYFAGPSHSYEQTYQAIRRCWRFGQTREVVVTTCATISEQTVLANLARKHADAMTMRHEMVRDVAQLTLRSRWADYYAEQTMRLPKWLK